MNAEEPEPIDSIPADSSPRYAALVQAIVGGSPAAEQEFVSLFLPKVRTMLLARTRNSDDAADLVQETILESLCALRRGSLREAEKLPGFVLAVARNLLNNHYRGAARAPESIEAPELLPDLTRHDESREREEREQLALEAISSLDSLDESILRLTLVDGLKPGIIAARLGISSDVVRQRKLRATRRVIEIVISRSQSTIPRHTKSGREP